MENTFESAIEYIKHLDDINIDWALDQRSLASAFMSYAAKTNNPTKEMLSMFVAEFREWQRQWDLFENNEHSKEPKSVDDFLEIHIMQVLTDKLMLRSYEKGYRDATSEACAEIAKNYRPNL